MSRDGAGRVGTGRGRAARVSRRSPARPTLGSIDGIGDEMRSERRADGTLDERDHLGPFEAQVVGMNLCQLAPSTQEG